MRVLLYDVVVVMVGFLFTFLLPRKPRDPAVMLALDEPVAPAAEVRA